MWLIGVLSAVRLLTTPIGLLPHLPPFPSPLIAPPFPFPLLLPPPFPPAPRRGQSRVWVARWQRRHLRPLPLGLIWGGAAQWAARILLLRLQRGLTVTPGLAGCGVIPPWPQTVLCARRRDASGWV